MKANFLPQQLVLVYLRVYINEQRISQAFAHCYLIVIILLSLVAWSKPVVNPVEHISLNLVSEDKLLSQIDKTSRTKIATLSPLGQQVPVANTNVASNIGGGFRLIKACESGGNYGAVNPAGYYGAYQFGIGTWNSTAQTAGRTDLVGIRPDKASPADQDAMAKQLHSKRGWQPWGCAYHVGLL